MLDSTSTGVHEEDDSAARRDPVRPSLSPRRSSSAKATKANGSANGSVSALDLTEAEEPHAHSACLQRWRSPTPAEARLLARVSIAVKLCMFALGLLVAVAGQSSSMLAFSLEAIVGVVSSSIVLWRFSGGAEAAADLEATPAVSGYSLRELHAAVAIGLSFALSGFVVLLDAVVHLARRDVSDHERALLGLAGPSWLILMGLGLAKMYTSRKLASDCLFEDGVCSMGSSLISLAIVLSIIARRNNHDVWYLDGSFAVVMSLAFFVYGAVIVYPHKWWRRTFWLGSQLSKKYPSLESLEGDVEDDATGDFRDVEGGLQESTF